MIVLSIIKSPKVQEDWVDWVDRGRPIIFSTGFFLSFNIVKPVICTMLTL
jgi:hypothetical protein